jgi:cobalt-zinc-cadmium efflux system outer membrane protein
MTRGRFVTTFVLATAMVTPAAAQGPGRPITLDGVAEQVVRRNLAIEAARHRLDAARAEQIGARLRPNPSLTVGGDSLKMTGPTPAGQLYEVVTTYSHPIELGGKRERRVEVADLTVAVAEAQVADVVHQRLVEAKRTFYEGLLARDALERARAIHKGYEDFVALTQARFEEGDVAEGEVIKARVEGARAGLAVTQAQLALRQAIIRLLDLLGETEVDPDQPLVGDLVAPPAPPSLLELKEIASRERPSLVAVQRAADLATRRVALERARATPDVSPYLGYHRIGENNTALLGISVPLPFTDRNQGGITKAVAEEKTARAEVVLHRNRTLAELESAWAAWQTARTRVQVLETALLRQAEESRDIAQTAYREGATGLLELLEAQRTLTDVRHEYARSLYEAQVSRLAVELAVGRELPR